MKRRLSVLSAAGLATLAMSSVANADLIASEDFVYNQFDGFVGAFARSQGFTGGYADATSGWAPGTGWGAFSNAGIAGNAQNGTELDNKALSGVLGGGGAGSGSLGRTWQPAGLAGVDTLWFSLSARHNALSRLVISDVGLASHGSSGAIDGDNTFAIGFAQGGGILAQIGPTNNAEDVAANQVVWNNDDLGFNTLFNQGGDPVVFGSINTIVGSIEFDVDGGSNERVTVQLLDPNDNSVILATRMFEAETALTDASGLGNEITLDYVNDNNGAIDWMAIGTSRDDVTGLVNPINPRLTLSVDGSGNATLQNNSGIDLDIDGFSITSTTGVLDGGALTGITSGGWATNQATSDIIVQSNFTGSSVIADGASVALGQIFSSLPGAAGVNFEFSSASGTQNVGIVDGLEEVILGDMNGDGLVDAFDVAPFELALADRIAFEAAFPGVDADLNGDIDESGALDSFDVGPFEVLLSGGASAAVPEPASLALVGLGLASLARRRRH